MCGVETCLLPFEFGSVIRDLEHEEVADVEVLRRGDLEFFQIVGDHLGWTLVDRIPFRQNNQSI